MSVEQVDTAALVERVREGLNLGIGPSADDPDDEQFAVSSAALDSLTAAYEEKEGMLCEALRDEALLRGAAEARAQKAEAELAQLKAAPYPGVASVDEPPTEPPFGFSEDVKDEALSRYRPIPGAGQDGC